MCECRTWRIVTLPRHGRQLCARQYEKPALKEGGLYSVDPVANAVDDGMQPAGDTGILRDPPSQGESRGVEEPPRVALIEFLEGGLIPFLHHLGDPLDVDHALPIEDENGVVGLLIGQEGSPVPLKGAGLVLALQGQRFDQLADEPRQVTLDEVEKIML